MFVYIIDRDGELDVYADHRDAERAQEILHGRSDAEDECGYPIVEQAVFASTSDKLDDAGTPTSQAAATMSWLEDLENDNG